MASDVKGEHENTQSDVASSGQTQETQDNAPGIAAPSKQQARHRASVACASCRDRRIRCVVPKGEAACTQCKRAGTECIIRNDDERRRPISKAYMSSLSRRIMLLESMLLERGVAPPPAVHPPKTRHEAQKVAAADVAVPAPADATLASSSRQPPPPPPQQATAPPSAASPDAVAGVVGVAREASPSRSLNPQKDDTVQRVLASKDGLPPDQLSALPSPAAAAARQLHEAVPPSEHAAVQSPPLATATHDYLLDCFWTFYNDTSCVVDRAAFEASVKMPSRIFYTSFLHVAVLAMGHRFSDRGRDDIQTISLGRYESTLQREAKRMLDGELQGPCGIPTVQGLLLLGDLECGAGRENVGWMYTCMARRLAFDMGLHRDARSADMSQQEVHTRHMVMQALAVTDRYWTVFLGRPTGIKSPNADAPCQPPCRATKPTRSEEVHECLFELMELVGKHFEARDMPAHKNNEENAYLHVIGTDRQLRNWYRSLPDALAWTPANVQDAPPCFFLLHQQYHACMILLHRPWAKYSSIAPSAAGGCESRAGDAPRIMDDSRTTLSRSICTQQAVHVARILWQHRQQLGSRRTSSASVQHAGTAAISLIAALAGQQGSSADRRAYLGYLEILAHALSDMGHIYRPAMRMERLLKAALDQLRSSVCGPDPAPGSDAPELLGGSSSGGGGNSSSSSSSSSSARSARSARSANGTDSCGMPSARRKSPDDADALRASKKRRTSEPAPAHQPLSPRSGGGGNSTTVLSVFSPSSSSRDRDAPRLPVSDWILDGPLGEASPDETGTPRSASATPDAKARPSLSAPLPLGPAAKIQGAPSDDAQHIMDWMDPASHKARRLGTGDDQPLPIQRAASIVGLVIPTVEGGGADAAAGGSREGGCKHSLDFFRF